MNNSELAAVFQALRPLLKRRSDGLVVVNDDDTNYYLDTKHILKNKKPLYFGSVQLKKNYVSFHLMPVYTHPELLNNLDPVLLKRMQGKSCFNFKTLDPVLIAKMSTLVDQCVNHYTQLGYIYK